VKVRNWPFFAVKESVNVKNLNVRFALKSGRFDGRSRELT